VGGRVSSPLLLHRWGHTCSHHQGSSPEGESQTIFIKIRAHRGEFLNEKADRWADELPEDVDNVRWDGPSSYPTFSWIDVGVEHRCSMNKTPGLQARVHLQVAELQLPFHKNFTCEFLNREDNSRDLLGEHWQDKTVLDRSKKRLLQSIDYQFPCTMLLKLQGLQENDECRLCKCLHPDVTPWPESLGHIQARCPALRKPRIAVHHGIWRELLTANCRNSLETYDDGERKWNFPSAVNEAIHNEWTVRQIFVHLGLFSGIRRLNYEIITFHALQNIVLTLEEMTSFYDRRPCGCAFDAKDKQCVFLEFTRPMDSVTLSDEGGWADRKELEKNERYCMHLYFINYLSALNGRPWNCSQANFTVRARGSLKRIEFQDRPCLLGLTNSKARDKIRSLTVSQTLALSNIILKLFHVSIFHSPEWALSSLPSEVANFQRERQTVFIT